MTSASVLRYSAACLGLKPYVTGVSEEQQDATQSVDTAPKLAAFLIPLGRVLFAVGCEHNPHQSLGLTHVFLCDNWHARLRWKENSVANQGSHACQFKVLGQSSETFVCSISDLPRLFPMSSRCRVRETEPPTLMC